MINNIVKQPMTMLNINQNIIEKLEKEKINTLGKLTNKTKADLKKFELDKTDIRKVEIELQLLGLDLKNSL